MKCARCNQKLKRDEQGWRRRYHTDCSEKMLLEVAEDVKRRFRVKDIESWDHVSPIIAAALLFYIQTQEDREWLKSGT